MSTDPLATNSLRQMLKMLDVQRQALEQEAGAIASELTAVNPANPTAAPVGIDTPLVDAEGYPRGDVDIYRARSLHSRLAVVKTDHQNLMKNIEGKLRQLALLQDPNNFVAEKKEEDARMAPKPKPKFDPKSGKWVVKNWDGSIAGSGKDEGARRLFDALLASNLPGVASNNTSPPAAVPTIHRANATMLTPLARVESVAPASPAFVAGLQPNDVIFAFGPACTMSDISDLVKTAAVNTEGIELRVRRADMEKLLVLNPRPWNCRGFLGCHILPID
jgi:26S proteasome regulatory subunit N4